MSEINAQQVRSNSVLYTGDCPEVLRTLPSESVDSIVTDPPAGISFMGKEWDDDKGGRDKWIKWMTGVAEECLRVLKPGAHALVWTLPRTSHWTAMAWENAGFEVRDRVSHIFGTGFPKSHNISKAIKKSAGWSTPEADEWEGRGTALKPAVEDWWLFRKPCSEDTIAENVLKHGTGALNIQACMIELPQGESVKINRLEGWSGFGQLERPNYTPEINDKGRWPANLITDGSECVVKQFPMVGRGKPGRKRTKVGNQGNAYGKDSREAGTEQTGYGDSGSAARFFYCAKPTQAERNFGVSGEAKDPATVTDFRPTKKTNPENWSNLETPYGRTTPRKNNHPTVKAKALMVYLIKLITPPGGVVLDAFCGSGSTGVACVGLGHGFIGIDKDPDSIEIARQRIQAEQPPLFIS